MKKKSLSQWLVIGSVLAVSFACEPKKTAEENSVSSGRGQSSLESDKKDMPDKKNPPLKKDAYSSESATQPRESQQEMSSVPALPESNERVAAPDMIQKSVAPISQENAMPVDSVKPSAEAASVSVPMILSTLPSESSPNVTGDAPAHSLNVVSENQPGPAPVQE